MKFNWLVSFFLHAALAVAILNGPLERQRPPVLVDWEPAHAAPGSARRPAPQLARPAAAVKYDQPIEAAPAPPAVTAAVSVSASPLPAREIRTAPIYPPAALSEGIEGRVLLELTTGLGGQVETTQVVESSGDDELDQAALAAVRRWRLQPHQKVRIPVEFKIAKGATPAS